MVKVESFKVMIQSYKSAPPGPPKKNPVQRIESKGGNRHTLERGLVI